MNIEGPAIREADVRIEAAKKSLREHLSELDHRVRSIRDKLAVSAQIDAHPHAAVGAALALGMIVGSRRHREEPNGVANAIAAAVTALAIRAFKDVALRQVRGAISSWLEDDRQGSPINRETRSSFEPATESFLEH